MTAQPFPMRRKVVERIRERDIGASSATAKCLAEEHRAAVADGRANGWHGMEEMKTAQRELAAKLVIPDDVLAGFYARQVDWCGKRSRQLAKALELSFERMGGPEDPSWPKLWAIDAKYRWYTGQRCDAVRGFGLLPRLEAAGHVLVCPQHGCQGIDVMEWEPFTLGGGAIDVWEALSLRGLLTGGGMLDWQASCEACAAPLIDTMTKRLLREEWPV